MSTAGLSLRLRPYTGDDVPLRAALAKPYPQLAQLPDSPTADRSETCTRLFDGPAL